MINNNLKAGLFNFVGFQVKLLGIISWTGTYCTFICSMDFCHFCIYWWKLLLAGFAPIVKLSILLQINEKIQYNHRAAKKIKQKRKQCKWNKYRTKHFMETTYDTDKNLHVNQRRFKKKNPQAQCKIEYISEIILRVSNFPSDWKCVVWWYYSEWQLNGAVAYFCVFKIRINGIND